MPRITGSKWPSRGLQNQASKEQTLAVHTTRGCARFVMRYLARKTLGAQGCTSFSDADFLHNKIGKKIQPTQATTTRAQRRLGCRLVLGSKQVTLLPSRQPGEGAWRLPTASIEISGLGTWRPVLSPFFTPIQAPCCFANTPGPVLPLGLCPCCSLYL